MTITKQTMFECDRCGKEEFDVQEIGDNETYPNNWEMRSIDGVEMDLCNACLSVFEQLKDDAIARYKAELAEFVKGD